MKGPNAAIVEALRSIYKVLGDLGRSINAAVERKIDKGQNETKISAEVRFSEGVERARAAGQKKQLFAQWVIAGAAWATFVAACIYAGIAYKQWKEMHHSLLLDQRAWMGFTEIQPGILMVGKPYTIRVQLKKFGKTPASDVASGLGVAILALNDKPQYENIVGPWMAEHGFSLPGDSQELMVNALRRLTGGMNQDDIENIQAGKSVVYVVGRASYRDIFNVTHETKYCFHSVVRATKELVFRECLDYNGADDNQE
jgi:hypothetical protein